MGANAQRRDKDQQTNQQMDGAGRSGLLKSVVSLFRVPALPDTIPTASQEKFLSSPVFSS